jgi:predicted DNA-binding transcriptional regulator YafY
MATKKPAPKATKADKSEKPAKTEKTLKPAPAKVEAKPAAKPAAKPVAKAAAKASPKAAAKPAAKPAPKAEAKPAVKAEAKPAKAVPAPKSAREAKAQAAAPQVQPLVPEAVEAPAAKPAPKPEPKAAAKARKSSAPAAFDANAARVLEAIDTGKAVELIFLDENANPPRTFEPRQLIFDVFTGAWFAWGWDRRYNAERHHRLDQLAEINLVEGPGRAAQGPYKDGTPANLIGGWLGGEPIPVKAILMKQWIFAVKQAPAPFPDFKMEDAPDGKASVSFTATDLRAIARWCMQFGDGIQVLEPQRLIDRIKQVGIAWGGKPVAAAAPPAPKPVPVAAPAPSSGHGHRADRERPDRDRGGHRRDRGEH